MCSPSFSIFVNWACHLLDCLFTVNLGQPSLIVKQAYWRGTCTNLSADHVAASDTYYNMYTCQPPEYKNLETNPKMFKVGAIFICGPFFLFFGFHFFQCYNSTLPRKLMDKKCKRATVGSSREIWCSNRETGRFHEKLGDSGENRESWRVCTT